MLCVCSLFNFMVSILRIPAKDPYAYGRALLDIVFTKEEQKSSTLMLMTKSYKRPLNQEKVHKLIGIIRTLGLILVVF